MKGLLLSMILKAIESLLTDEVIDNAKKDLIKYLRELAKETDNKLDDALVDLLEKALN